jgi:hypothetical protein
MNTFSFTNNYILSNLDKGLVWSWTYGSWIYNYLQGRIQDFKLGGRT